MCFEICWKALLKHISEDHPLLSSLPKEPDAIIGAETSVPSELQSGLELNSPVLPAIAVSTPAGSSHAFAQTDQIGYVVERYKMSNDISISTPEKVVYVDSPSITNMIDTTTITMMKTMTL